MMYSVYYMNAKGKWELLLSGLDMTGAKSHAEMYKRLFDTDTMIIKE